MLAVSIRPFYLPWEFPQLFVILVYVHPKPNADNATEHILSTLNKLEHQTHPNSY